MAWLNTPPKQDGTRDMVPRAEVIRNSPWGICEGWRGSLGAPLLSKGESVIGQCRGQCDRGCFI